MLRRQVNVTKKKLTDQTIDAFVGKRLRAARKEARLSQGALGEKIGLTFQQIQKHENGEVRISAGRLMKLAGALKVPIEYFFEGICTSGNEYSIPNSDTQKLSKLSEIKSTCIQLVADANDADVEIIVGLLRRIGSYK